MSKKKNMQKKKKAEIIAFIDILYMLLAWKYCKAVLSNICCFLLFPDPTGLKAQFGGC